jgi:mitochondrial-processing peptidase subunit alpha
MNTILGSAQGFSSGGPGKGMYCRAITNILTRFAFAENAAGINHHFTDTGLWGINIQGPSSHSKDLLYVALAELNKFWKPIPAVELQRAKNILKMNILSTLERDDHRLEEIAKNYMTFGSLTHEEYLNKIDNVTSE